MTGLSPVVNLGEVCDLQNGFAFKSKLFKESGTPVLRISSIQGEEVSENRPVFVNENDYSEDLSRYYVYQGDLLIAMSGGTTGKIGFLKSSTRYLLNQRVGKFKPTSKLDKQYLFYFLLTKSEESLKISAGSAQPNLSTKQIKEFRLPLPPLEEQKRIVAILDEAFAGIDTAIANTEKNLANARELFESYLNSVFTNQGGGWITSKLVNLTTKIGSGATPKGGERSYKKEGISLFRSLNVYDRRFTDRKLAFIDDEQAEKLSNVVVDEGDVLFNITGASVARCCVAPKDYLPARVNQHVSILRPEKEVIDTKFLCYLMTSRIYKDQLLGIGDEGGSTRQAITKSQLQELKITIPDDLTEQKNIVQQLESLESETLRLESIHKQKQVSLIELKQSLLQKAFSGELTAEGGKLMDEAVA